MALLMPQRTTHLPVIRKASSATRLVRAVWILVVTYENLRLSKIDELSPSASPTRCRDSSADGTQTGVRYATRLACLYGERTGGIQYASAVEQLAPPRPEAVAEPKRLPARPEMRALVKNEVVSNLAGVPVELMVKDLWNQIFHKAGRQHWLNLIFWVKGYLKYKDARKVAIMITWELQRHLYEEAPVNDTAWKATRRQLEEHIREWWQTCPEDPYRALTVGVWKSLVKVYGDHLEPVLRGSPKLQELDALLFDPELKVIRTWTDAAHLSIVRGPEEEIVAKLDSLARERRRERMATVLSVEMPVPTRASKSAEAPAEVTHDKEVFVDRRETQRKKESASKRETRQKTKAT